MRPGARARAIGILILVAAPACGPGRHDVTIERMDVALTVLVDGSIQVEERMAARFGTSPVSTFRRRTPVWRHDGVFDVSAAMDGASFTPGRGAGHLQVGKGPDLDVQWTFAPASDSLHTFVLDYRAANAVAISGIRGTVSWLVLPARRAFEVSAAGVTLTLPDAAVLLQDPWVEEAGWQVARLPHGLTAKRAAVPSAESETVGIEFTVDRMAVSTPQWQSDEEFLAEFIPAFVAAAVFILIVAVGAVWMVRFKYPPWRLTHAGLSGVDELAIAITPAMRVAIERGRCRGDRIEVHAAIDGLVAGGAVTADGDRLRLANADQAGTQHEQVVTSELWLHKRDGMAKAALLSRQIGRRFRRALLADLITAGVVDRERATVQRDLRRAGLVVTLFGLASWAAVSLTVTQFGAWPLAVPWSIVLAGVIFLVAAARFQVLSDAGAKARMLYFARVLDGRTTE